MVKYVSRYLSDRLRRRQSSHSTNADLPTASSRIVHHDRFSGSIDLFEGGSFLGWAIDRNHSGQLAGIVVCVDQRVQGVSTTGLPRPDVAAVLDVKAQVGFRHIVLPEDVRIPDSLKVYVVAFKAAEEISRLLSIGSVDVTILIQVCCNQYSLLSLHNLLESNGNLGITKPRMSETGREILPISEPQGMDLVANSIAAFDIPTAQVALKSLMTANTYPLAVERHLESLGRIGDSRRGLRSHTKDLFYISCVARQVSDNDPQALKHVLGAAHYSYSYAMKGFTTALESIGYRTCVLNNPEYWPEFDNDGIKRIHLGFYPPEEPRFLKGAYNIVCLAWEFERLRSLAEVTSYQAFADPGTMLNQSDAIITHSQFGVQALHASGVANINMIPTPVTTTLSKGRLRKPSLDQMRQCARQLDRIRWQPLAIYPPAQSSLSRQSRYRAKSLSEVVSSHNDVSSPTIFYLIFNVHDYRKQIRPVIEAFVRLEQHFENAILLLKLTISGRDDADINQELFDTQISEQSDICIPLVSDRILMTREVLSRDEMLSLSNVSAYTLCTSHGEGQNLVLIEAMANGVVPVSVNNTAMADYINNQNAIVIDSEFRAMTPRLSVRYGMYGVKTYYVRSEDVYLAMSKAMNQPEDVYERMSTSAVETVKTVFGIERFKESIRNIINQVSGLGG